MSVIGDERTNEEVARVVREMEIQAEEARRTADERRKALWQELSNLADEYLGSSDHHGMQELLEKFHEKCLFYLGVSASADQGEQMKFIARLSFLHTVHLLRNKWVLAEDRTLRAALGCFSDWLQAELRILEQAHYRRPRASPIHLNLSPKIKIAGYDPRYRFEADAKGVVSAYQLVDGINSELFLKNNYHEAKSKIYSDFHNPETRYDLLIVDFAWLPELAYRGYLIPLDDFWPNFEQRCLRPAVEKCLAPADPNLSKTDIKAEVDCWTSTLSHLSKAGNLHHYAYPLLINCHGRLYPKTATDIPQMEIREDIGYGHHKDERFNHENCAIQTAHSACSVYELYAHFAYHGAKPIIVEDDGEGGLYSVKVVDFTTSTETLDALRNYLLRILMNNHLNPDDRFSVDHEKEIIDIRQQGGPQWDLCFNTELFSRLDERWQICRQFKRERQIGVTGEFAPCWLTSIGGYGVAISKQATRPDEADKLASKLFNRSADDKLIISGDVLKACRFGEDENRDIASFLELHVRPRVPAWNAIEEAMSFALEELAQECETFREKHSNQKDFFARARLIVNDALDAENGRRILRRLNNRIRVAVTNSGGRYRLIS